MSKDKRTTESSSESTPDWQQEQLRQDHADLRDQSVDLRIAQIRQWREVNGIPEKK